MLAILALIVALVSLAMACSAGNVQEAGTPAARGSPGEEPSPSPSATPGDASNRVPAVNVPATVAAVLTRVAPTPAPTIDVQATITAELTRIAPPTPASPTLSPTPTAGPSISDVVENIKDGLVQIITPGASGSGFAVSNDGLIVTNAHVVEEHELVTVRSVSGWSYGGVVHSKDDDLDLAVIKIAPLGSIPAMPLGDASRIRPGDPVIAMGFQLSDQLGDGYSVTTGIVSSVRMAGSTERIQTDAAVNAGSSGGPLVNSAGEVIGVNTTTFREYHGVSIAISVAEVKNYLDAVFDGSGSPVHAYLKFDDYHNEACHYSLRVPSQWMNTGEHAGCRISLGRYKENDQVGAANIWEYSLNDGETLDDFSVWWSDSLTERANSWNVFTRISSERAMVERNGKQQEEHVIKYRWQETEDHCVSFATDRVVVSDYRRVALVFNTSVCDFMPPSVIEETALMELEVWTPTQVRQRTSSP